MTKPITTVTCTTIYDDVYTIDIPFVKNHTESLSNKYVLHFEKMLEGTGDQISSLIFTNKNELLTTEPTKAKTMTNSTISKTAKTSTQNVVSTPRLDEIATAIKSHVDEMNSHAFEAGKLLSESFDMFKKSADWLVWVEANTGLRKAHAYRLKAVFIKFQDEPCLKALTLAALTTLLTSEKETAQIVKDAIKKGHVPTTNEIKELNQEIIDDKTDETDAPKTPKKDKPTIEEMTPKQAAKVVKETTEAAKLSAEKFTRQIHDAVAAKDAALLSSRELSSKLKNAELTIKEQQATIENYVEQLESLKAQLAKAVANQAKPKAKKDMTKGTEEVQNGFDFGDLDVNEHDKVSEVLEVPEVDPSVQLLDFENAFTTLQANNPMKCADNTALAAEMANIPMIKEGRKIFFAYNGENITGLELRKLLDL